MTTATQNMTYTLVQRHSADHVELKFSGTFLTQPIIWDAHIHTLHDYWLHQQTATGIMLSQAFIDITVQQSAHTVIVALNLPKIDEAAILGTIIMVRQYKRLQTGRHCYGDMVTLSYDSN